MIFSPIISGGAGGEFKPVPYPEGITFESDTISNGLRFRFLGLTKENIKKGCLLCVHDSATACVLHVHEDGKIDMYVGPSTAKNLTPILVTPTPGETEYKLWGPSTVTGETTGVEMTKGTGAYTAVPIGLE